MQGRRLALRTWRPFARRDMSMRDRVLSWIRWHAKRRSTRTAQRLAPGSVLALMRNLRQVLVREGKPDVGRYHWWKDVRTHFVKLNKQQVGLGAATPLSVEQYRQLHELADEHPRSVQLKRALVVLGAVGAARIAELTRRSAMIVDQQQAFDVIVFPKGGRELKVASLPAWESIRQRLGMEGRTVLRRPLPVDAYQLVYDHIKTVAARRRWPAGKWTTYSIRHMALSMAFALPLSGKEELVRLQTGHVRNIPVTYRLRRNPRREGQLQVVEPVMGQLLSPTGVAGSEPVKETLMSGGVDLEADSHSLTSSSATESHGHLRRTSPGYQEVEQSLGVMEAVRASLPRPPSPPTPSSVSRCSRLSS